MTCQNPIHVAIQVSVPPQKSSLCRGPRSSGGGAARRTDSQRTFSRDYERPILRGREPDATREEKESAGQEDRSGVAESTEAGVSGISRRLGCVRAPRDA